MNALDGFIEGDIRSLSRLVSQIENRADGFREILGRLFPKTGKSFRLGITGPPGSGKSTLLNIVCGLDSPTSGSVLVDGLELAGMSSGDLARYRRDFPPRRE